MNRLEETPAKRRKLDNGLASSQAYDSADDDGDDLFEGYETVATVPLFKNTTSPTHQPNTFITQPTQILPHYGPTEDEQQSQVQVPASSPVASSTPSYAIRGGKLANSMAPAGTAFRLPLGVASSPITKKPVIDLSDDDVPTYQGSSDEDSQSNRNIKPSTFVAGKERFGTTVSKFAYSPNIQDQNKSSLSGSVFDSRNRDETSTKSKITAPKRSADIMANAYGGSTARIPPRPKPKQTEPAKARPANDLDIDDIPDYQVRDKVKRMRTILPTYSVLSCRRALEVKRNNFDDALDYLVSKGEGAKTVDLTISDGEDPLSSHAPMQKKAPVKQQVKVKQNIQEKWASTQNFARQSEQSSPVAEVSPPAAAPPKPRRRLIQGRKQGGSSPAAAAPTPIERHAPIRVSPSLDSDDSDSGVGSEAEDDELENKLLEYFNHCEPKDLSDMATITEEVAGLVLSQRPFGTLTDIRQISNEDRTKSGKVRRPKKQIGDKIVDKCLDMYAGYEAVDKLVEQCEEISKPLKEDMKGWGVDIFGSATQGELELASLPHDVSPRDSGIGTPTSLNVSDTDGEGDPKTGSQKRGLFPQPSNMPEDVKLKDYQLIGVNWLSLMYERGLSAILADDMGLGKTIQVISLLAHLLEKGVKGPHLVIVPSSCLENWLREFSMFCPQLSVMPYYASQNERPGIQAEILGNKESINVVVSTYPMAKAREDNKFLRKLKPTICIYDEGHLLKNSKSNAYEMLMRIPSIFRLLLTGTPLQNNLTELASLLGFILPSVFNDHRENLEAIFSHKAKTSDASHAALLSSQRIARAKKMLTPFVLRRKKHQVLKYLPTKTQRIEYCDLSASQAKLYEEAMARQRRIVSARAAGKRTGNESSNIMMALRQASISSLLFRKLYNDQIISQMSRAILKESEFRDRDQGLIFEDMGVMTDMELLVFCEGHKTMKPFLLKNDEWMDSGKVKKLAFLLEGFKANGDRVLIFSQFTMVMNILERVMETLDMSFFRLDGSTNVNERQTMLDEFHDDPSITVFLLSTKAGGAGINLSCANKVIVFDMSFNPQEDVQAENRAHRLGQTREVEVIRLVTKGTIEEPMLALGETKLALDDRVAGDDVVNEPDTKIEKQGMKVVEQRLLEKITEEVAKDEVTD